MYIPQLVSSTKHSMSRDSMEFVLGIGQVVKAFDRALPQMSIGKPEKFNHAAVAMLLH